MLDLLKNAKRLLAEAELEPLQGARFQPTGFPDLGAATYPGPDGNLMLLVESAQSVANHLESMIIGPNNELVPELKGLSYIRVKFAGGSDASTNSLTEAHRMNSPFIISDEYFQDNFKSEADYAKGKPLNWQKIARAVFKYDVNSLLHGVFLANLEDGRIKMARALSGFIEATGVREAVSGGVKNNPIDPSGNLRVSGYDKNVYGNVPFQRVEYTAGSIKAFFNLDLGLLHSYALGDEAYELLLGLGLLKVRRFLESGLRLRTACNLQLRNGILVTSPQGFDLPSEQELLSLVQARISSVKSMFAEPPVTELVTETFWKKKDDPGAASEEAESEEEVAEE